MEGGFPDADNRRLDAARCVTEAAAPFAASSILRVIDAVVFGLISNMRMGSPFSQLAAEVKLLHPLITEKLRGIPREPDRAGGERIGPL